MRCMLSGLILPVSAVCAFAKLIPGNVVFGNPVLGRFQYPIGRNAGLPQRIDRLHPFQSIAGKPLFRYSYDI